MLQDWDEQKKRSRLAVATGPYQGPPAPTPAPAAAPVPERPPVAATPAVPAAPQPPQVSQASLLRQQDSPEGCQLTSSLSAARVTQMVLLTLCLHNMLVAQGLLTGSLLSQSVGLEYRE